MYIHTYCTLYTVFYVYTVRSYLYPYIYIQYIIWYDPICIRFSSFWNGKSQTTTGNPVTETGRPILRAVALWRWHRRCPFGAVGCCGSRLVFFAKVGCFICLPTTMFSGENFAVKLRGCICFFFFGGGRFGDIFEGKMKKLVFFEKKFVCHFVWCLDGVIQKRTGRPLRNAWRALHLDGVRWRWQRSTTRILRWQEKNGIDRSPPVLHDRFPRCWFQVLSCGRVRDTWYVSSGFCFQNGLIFFFGTKKWGVG